MGQINCHCQSSQNQILQSQHLRKQPTMGIPITKRRTKSRVNSIISPRQIAAFSNNLSSQTIHTLNNVYNSSHKKVQSNLDLRNWSKKTTYNFDKNREKVLKNLKQRYKQKQSINYAKFQFNYHGLICKIQANNQQKQLELQYIPRNQTQASNFSKIKDNYYNFAVSTEIDHQIFSLSLKYVSYSNDIGRLLIRDNQEGLGVFKYIRQKQSIRIDLQQSTFQQKDQFTNDNKIHQNQSQQVLLDIAVGQFLIIKVFYDQSQKQKNRDKLDYYAKCLLINRNKNFYQYTQKTSKSLPSLFLVNNIAPTNTPTNNQLFNNYSTRQSTWIIREGQQKTIHNRVCIRIPSRKDRQRKEIIIQSVHSQGFYKQLSKFEEVKNGCRLRCGSRMYKIQIGTQNQGCKNRYIMSKA